FGYDSPFHVPEYDCRAAELDNSTKNRLSHRGKATAALLLKLQSR
ncbi:MAG: XTP/dITP diphosphohydrolase, partial [Oceanospirillaceae bacterium]